MSIPLSSAAANERSVFSGASSGAPRWPIRSARPSTRSSEITAGYSLMQAKRAETTYTSPMAETAPRPAAAPGRPADRPERGRRGVPLPPRAAPRPRPPSPGTPQGRSPLLRRITAASDRDARDRGHDLESGPQGVRDLTRHTPPMEPEFEDFQEIEPTPERQLEPGAVAPAAATGSSASGCSGSPRWCCCSPRSWAGTAAPATG